MKSRKNPALNDNYWSQVYIALAQITFGAAWALLFLPLSNFSVITIIANLLITAILIFLGHLKRRTP